MTLAPGSRQDHLYQEAAEAFGGAIERLGHAYEADPDTRRDLLQDIHLALWRSFATYDGRCSLRTWVYRVAHNVSASHVTRWVRVRRLQLTSLEEAESLADGTSPLDHALDRVLARNRLLHLIRRLDALDRQVIVSYLEDMDAAAIAEITGLSAGAVAMKVHRIKHLLARWFQQGEGHGR